MVGVTPSRTASGPAWVGELVTSQLQGLESWQAAWRGTVRSAEQPGLTCEQHLDAARLLAVGRRQQEAIVERIEQSWSS